MGDVVTESGKGPSAAAQIFTAVLLVGGLAIGLWGFGFNQQEPAGRKPAECGKSHDELPPRYVSGARLCAALNRADLPALLGTPSDIARTADGSGYWSTLAGGTKQADPQATVTLATYSVKISASYADLSIAELADLLGDSVQQKSVLGHPAMVYSDRTIAYTFGDKTTDTRPGSVARHLVVAMDAEDGGDYFEVVVWRQDDLPPDDTALLRVTEQVLPTVPGWSA